MQATKSLLNQNSIISKTYILLGLSLMVTGIGIYVGMENIGLIKQYFLPIVIVEFLIIIFGLSFSREKEGLNTFMLYFYALLSGLTLSLVFDKFIGAGNSSLLYQAGIMTLFSFAVLSYVAINTSYDFKSLGGILLIGLLVLIVGGLLNIFFFHNPLLQFLLASAGVIVFSFLILYDTQHIVEGNYSPVDGAISMHLNLFNLFLDFLQILKFLDGED